MYCSECGTLACGKFCHKCGSRIIESADSAEWLEASSMDEAGWQIDSRYDRIVQIKSVREAISQSTANAKATLSGEAFLDICDKIVASPIPLSNLAAIVQPIYDSWGIRTGKARSESLNQPVGLSIARTLCSFARNSQTFKTAEQIEDGCLLSAELPSTICSLKGTISVVLRSKDDRQTVVDARTGIPGQLYDWGKSERCLQQLFNDLVTGLPDLTISHRRDAA